MSNARVVSTLMAGLLVAGTLVATGCATSGSKSYVRAPETTTLPEPPREFRAAWVCTVANINWPSKPGLSTDVQKEEMIQILDDAKSLGLNAVVFQVRPSADALYQSDLEPWSYFLTGEQGKAPEPFYDPLTEWVAEAHKRGLELHAWFNPYRAGHPSQKGGYADSSLVTSRPDLAKKYGKHYWIDPAEPDGQKHTVAVFMDVVKRYDVDGIHIDDYFYPYKEKDEAGNVLDFPDEPAWTRYTAAGGTLSRPDWRRAQVNDLVSDIYLGLRSESRFVKFGISPFGLCRPNQPEGVPGFDQYDQLYADARLWLHRGWFDYWTPQLYWAIDSPQSFPKLLDFWMAENTMHRHIWPGLGTYNYTAAKFTKGPIEVIDQIEITRQRGANGHVHFQFATLKNEKLEPLIREAYAKPALVPATPWLDDHAPVAPIVKKTKVDGKHGVAWKQYASESEDVLDRAFLWVVATRTNATDEWSTASILPAQETSWIPAEGSTVGQVAIAAVDRAGNMGPAAVVTVGK